MKRIFITIIAVAAMSLAAGAQDMYYAEMLSRNNYYGTARSVALGNAMTALGGDLGSIGINPAGSAVAPYGQLTITPGVLISSSGASYSADGSETFGKAFKTSHPKFNLPNLGLTMVMYSNSYSAVDYVTIGIVANTSNTFLNYTTAHGENSATSFLGSLAAGARGQDYSNLPRDLYSAYAANQIGEFGPVGSNNYVGANQRLNSGETYAYVPGTLDQTAVYNTYGSKTDLAFNMGFSIQNSFYVGFNLGIPFLTYQREEVFAEAAQNPSAFPTIFEIPGGKDMTNYQSSDNTYKLNTKATGLYAKVGFIALPTEHLRIGAAIQTPTLYQISESWRYFASACYENPTYDGEAMSSLGEYSYNLRSPYVFNAGIAYTLPGVGLFSLDYELTDYSVMKYKDIDQFYSESTSWDRTNLINRTFCGSSHAVRTGIEVKPLPELAIRAGYSILTDPEKYWDDEKGNRVTAETVQFIGNSSAIRQNLVKSHHFDSITHAVSLGAGYSSPGSFYADLAVRLTSYPIAYYSPYYYGAYDAVDSGGRSINVGAPLEKLERSVYDVMMTLGWRF